MKIETFFNYARRAHAADPADLSMMLPDMLEVAGQLVDPLHRQSRAAGNIVLRHHTIIDLMGARLRDPAPEEDVITAINPTAEPPVPGIERSFRIPLERGNLYVTDIATGGTHPARNTTFALHTGDDEPRGIRPNPSTLVSFTGLREYVDGTLEFNSMGAIGSQGGRYVLACDTRNEAFEEPHGGAVVLGPLRHDRQRILDRYGIYAALQHQLVEAMALVHIAA